MSRRLLLMLIAATQLAALPVSVDPPEVEFGRPVTITVTLPETSTELVGFPEIEPFALLTQPERFNNELTFRLLALRPGKQTIPSFAFRTDQNLERTEPVTLTIAVPQTPEEPHPLRSFPYPEREGIEKPSKILPVLAAGIAVLVLILTVLLKRRRSHITQPAPDLDEQFTQLAAAVRLVQDLEEPEWQQFSRQLEKVRFAPLLRNEEQLRELTTEFVRLRGEQS